MLRSIGVLLLLSSQLGFASFERLNHGGRSVAMGGSVVALKGNEWSAFTNPAALHSLEVATLSVAFVPQQFELKELSHGAVSFVLPTSVGTVAISGTRFGFELYKETGVTLSYSNVVGGILLAGANINYYSLTIQNYGSASTIGVDVGLFAELSEDVRWGFAAFNLNAASIGSTIEKLPQIFSTGLGFHPIQEATITASIVKDIRYPLELHVGVEYTMLDIVSVRAGTTTDPSTLNAGIGLNYSFLQLDYAFSSHSELGMTHQFSLSIKVGEL